MRNFRANLFRSLRVFRNAHRNQLIQIPGLIRFFDFFCDVIRPAGQILTRGPGFDIWIDARDEIIGFQLLANGLFDPPMTFHFEKHIKPGMVVVDIGANIGYFSLLAASRMKGEGSVYAFEPDPYNFSIFKKNIDLNKFNNISLFQLALSNTSKSLLLFKDRYNLGAHTLIPENLAHPKGQETVNAIPFDDWAEDQGLTHIDLIKIDIEGSEGFLLEKADILFKQPSLVIFMEFWPAGLTNMGSNPEAILRKFEEAGFSISIIENTQNLRRCSISDILTSCHDDNVNLLIQKKAV